jgi:hypothetical protein
MKKGVGKGKKYRAIIVPVGAKPYDVDLETDEKGCVEHDGKMWFILPGSSWPEGNKQRVILPEALAESLVSSNLTGKTFFGARMFFMHMKLNLLEQLHKIQNTKPWYGQAQVWIIAGAIGLLILVGYLGLSQVTDAISGLGDDIRNMRPPTGGDGHQPLNEGRS